MYNNKVKFLGYIENSIKTNMYGIVPYREIALIDVVAEVKGEKQICRLPFYRSSGTNSEKVKGEWYPILGIKEAAGEFNEFSEWVNLLLNKWLGKAEEGWLVKNIFFAVPVKYKTEEFIPSELKHLRGYGYASHGHFLKEVSQYIKQEFDLLNTEKCYEMNVSTYNDMIYSEDIYSKDNTVSQIEIFTLIVNDMFLELYHNE